MAYTWTDPTVHVFAVGEVVSAASMNSYIQQNLALLGQSRAAAVATSESTATGTYTDLTTVGPTVTVNTMTAVIIMVTAFFTSNNTGGGSIMSAAVSSATTLAASDAWSSQAQVTVATSMFQRQGSTSLLSGLTGGSNIFTSKYRSNSVGTSSFSNRHIAVIPLTS